MDNAGDLKVYKNNLLNELWLSREYDAAAGLRRKVLLVEGSIDKAFIGRVQDEDVRCLSVKEFMKKSDPFRTSRTSEPQEFNSKLVITTILMHIALFPEYLDFPKGAETWPLYGMVDRDNDDDHEYMRVTKLFFTDTHDLESMLISTDAELLFRLNQCSISAEDVHAALYIADQLAAYRMAIRKNEVLDHALINEPDGTVNYDAFTKGDRIILKDLLQHISRKMEKPLSKEKLKKTVEAIKKDMRKKLDKEGMWKKTPEAFLAGDHKDFWINVNGHDILSAICYKNPDVRQVFNNQRGFRMNRDFEFALVKAYDYDCFRKTDLCGKLETAGLLK